jgi:hypothetical protein
MEDKIINNGMRWHEHVLRIHEERIPNNILNMKTGKMLLRKTT